MPRDTDAFRHGEITSECPHKEYEDRRCVAPLLKVLPANQWPFVMHNFVVCSPSWAASKDEQHQFLATGCSPCHIIDAREGAVAAMLSRQGIQHAMKSLNGRKCRLMTHMSRTAK